MIYVASFSIVCLFCAIWGIKFTSKLFNPLTVFCGIWFVIFFLSSLQLYDIKQASFKVFMIMMLGTISFVVGFVIDYYFLKHKRIIVSKVRSNNCDYFPRYRLIYGLMLFTLFFTIIGAKNSIGILLDGGNLDAVLIAVRKASASARGTIRNVINNLIVGPFTFAVFPICAYNIANKKHNELSILVIMQMLLGIVSSGGRAFLIYLIVLLCVGFTFSGECGEQIKRKIEKTKKKRFLLLMGIFLALFV